LLDRPRRASPSSHDPCHASPEFDPLASNLIDRRDGLAVVRGTAPVNLVEHELGLDFAEAHEATVGGHVVELLGRLPEQGEVVELAGCPVEIVAVAEGRIVEMRVPLDGSRAATR
jgi:CBS domain containing-hemolysin-like protein